MSAAIVVQAILCRYVEPTRSRPDQDRQRAVLPAAQRFLPNTANRFSKGVRLTGLKSQSLDVNALAVKNHTASGAIQKHHWDHARSMCDPKPPGLVNQHQVSPGHGPVTAGMDCAAVLPFVSFRSRIPPRPLPGLLGQTAR